MEKRGEKFRALIYIDGKRQHLGTFDTSKKAARAYDRAAMQAGRPPTKLNYQDKVPMDYKPKMKKLASNNTIGYRGVIKKGNRFQAQISIDGRKHYLGYFGTKKEAAIAFDLAAIQAKRPKSDLNFPDMIHVKKEIPKIKKRKLVTCTNTTGFNGVSKAGKKFQAQIQIDDRRHHIGMFGTTKEAAIAWDLAAIQAKRPKSDLNFPDMIHVKKEIPKIKKRKLVKCTNKTGFNGVSKQGKKFRAQISINGKQKNLGRFTRARDAAMAYDEAIVASHLPWKKLNFPDGMPIEDQSDDDDGFWA